MARERIIHWKILPPNANVAQASGGIFAPTLMSVTIIFVHFVKIAYFVILVTYLFAVIKANDSNQGGAYE